jgi:hypothetical protein
VNPESRVGESGICDAAAGGILYPLAARRNDGRRDSGSKRLDDSTIRIPDEG